MKIVFIFMWYAFTFSKNFILIGDSRTYLMAANLFGFPLTPESIIKNENPFRYRGHNIYVIAKKGASAMNFATSSGVIFIPKLMKEFVKYLLDLLRHLYFSV